MIRFDEDDDRFYIKESNIPNAGKGLFASKMIMAGEYLPITGVMVERDSVADKCTHFFNSYKFAANVKIKNDQIDIGKFLIIPLGYASMVNHTSDKNQQSVEIRYTGDQYPQKSQHQSKAIYWFVRDVYPDEEILGSYGEKWGEVLEWVNEQHSKMSSEKSEWKKFIEYDLYGLKKLIPDHSR